MDDQPIKTVESVGVSPDSGKGFVDPINEESGEKVDISDLAGSAVRMAGDIPTSHHQSVPKINDEVELIPNIDMSVNNPDNEYSISDIVGKNISDLTMSTIGKIEKSIFEFREGKLGEMEGS